MAETKTKTKALPEIINRKATYQYQFVDIYEAGIVLNGTEIKSIRKGHVNLNDAYCYFKRGELYLRSMYVKEYEHGNIYNHEPRRARKLLLHRRQLKKLEKKVKEKGFTIVPHKLYFNDRGIVKIEIALAQGKKSYDKRKSIKEKDVKRDLDRQMRNYKF